MRNTSAQQGFTLIELVIVIVVLGILAALAVPRFISLQSEARIAVVDSLFNVVRSSSNIVYAKAAAGGVAATATGTVDIDGASVAGGNVALNFGYPVATQANLSLLFDNISPRYNFTGGGAGGGSTLTIRIDGVPNCQITYTSPNASGSAPTIVRTVTGC